MPKDKESQGTWKYLKRLLRGGVRSIPWAGGLIEEAFWGSTDERRDAELRQKLDAIQQSVQEQNKSEDGRLEGRSTQVSPSRMPNTGDILVGRSRELGRLTRAWNDPKTNLISIVAWGGVGKTSLVQH